MPIFDTFSKRRNREAQAGQPEVYKYDLLPPALRVQIAHICRDAMGSVAEYGHPAASRRWNIIYGIVIRELGVFSLGDDYDSIDVRCINYFIAEKITLRALDFVEVAFKVINAYGVKDTDEYGLRNGGVGMSSSSAVDELNGRFRENSIC